MKMVNLTIIAAASVWLAAGCSTMSVSSYVQRSTDFRQYHTYSWGRAEALSTGDPRLDNNPFFDERIRAQVEKELALRGFEKTASPQPDVLVHYHARVAQEVVARADDLTLLECEDDDCYPTIYEKGTLVIDLVEPGTAKVIWRGWAESNIDGVIDDQTWLEARIDQTIAKILARLPQRF
jgi:hypothetical protein